MPLNFIPDPAFDEPTSLWTVVDSYIDAIFGESGTLGLGVYAWHQEVWFGGIRYIIRIGGTATSQSFAVVPDKLYALTARISLAYVTSTEPLLIQSDLGTGSYTTIATVVPADLTPDPTGWATYALSFTPTASPCTIRFHCDEPPSMPTTDAWSIDNLTCVGPIPGVALRDVQNGRFPAQFLGTFKDELTGTLLTEREAVRDLHLRVRHYEDLDAPGRDEAPWPTIRRERTVDPI